jgi:epoxide hydrolase-like predicted phosphatase
MISDRRSTGTGWSAGGAGALTSAGGWSAKFGVSVAGDGDVVDGAATDGRAFDGGGGEPRTPEVPMIRAVVFDIGGVLELTPATGWHQRWCSRLGLAEERFRALLGDANRAGGLGTINLERYTATVQRLLGLDGEQTAAFMDDLWNEYLGTPNTELIDYFTGLRKRVRTGILLNSFVGAREREQERYGYEDRCDVIVYSHEIGMMKPDPAAYTTVCDLLVVGPSEVVFVDNLEMCVEGAEAVGMEAVLFRDNEQAISEIESYLDADS